MPAVPSSEILPADQHPVAVYLATLAPGSRRTMRAPLTWIAGELSGGRQDLRTFPWAQLRHQHVAAIRQLLIDGGRAPATINRYLAALRGILRACWRLGLIDGEAYHRAIDVAPARGSRLPRGRALQPAELDALFTSCKADLDARRAFGIRDPGELRRCAVHGARDAAMLGLLFGCGLRRAEVCDLDVGDLAVRGSVRVLGKGNKERLVPLPAGTVRALRVWLQLRGMEPGPLILPLSISGWPERRRMTPQGIYMALRARVRSAQIRTLSPHDLRRSYISSLLDAGVDLSAASQLAGHAQVQTTRRYDRREHTALERAAAKLRVPF